MWVIEIIIGVILIVVFIFVLWPIFKDASKETAPRAGMSASYFLGAGLTEYYIVEPLLVRTLIYASLNTPANSGTPQAVRIGQIAYWTVIVVVYYIGMKNYIA